MVGGVGIEPTLRNSTDLQSAVRPSNIPPESSRSGNRTHLGVLMRHFSSTRTVSCLNGGD